MNEEKRFVLINHKCDISIIDTETNNAELFGIVSTNQEDANMMANALDPIVCALNEQDRILKKHNLKMEM